VNDGNYGSNSDFITSTKLNGGSGALTVAGDLDKELRASETVQVRLVDADGTHPTDWDNATTIGTSWSVNLASVSDGAYNIEAVVKNAAGGATTPVTHALTVDNTAPVEKADLTNVADSQKPDPGGNPNFWVTNDNNYRPAFSGTLSGGTLADGKTPGVTSEQLQIGLQDTQGSGNWVWNSVTVTPDGKWNYTPDTDLVAGATYNVGLRVVDLAGNVTMQDGAYKLGWWDSWGFIFTDPPAPDSATLAPPQASSNNTLNLSLHDVLSDAGALTGAGGSAARPVTINSGGAVSTVHLVEGVGAAANQWQDTGTTTVNGVLYDLYHNTAQGTSSAANLLIQHGIAVI
jgi:hypothetical protein